jgi:hypothetical protein
MKYRCIPPDPSEFPKARLVVPFLVPFALVAVGMLGSEAGHLWNIHGDGALLLGAIFISGLAAFFVTLLAFVRGVADLTAYPSLRSHSNLASVSVAGVPLVVAVLGVAYAVLT